MKNFYETPHCRSGVHCKICRETSEEGEAFRNNISQQYEVSPSGNNKFSCPKNISWNSTPLTISAKSKKKSNNKAKNIIKSVSHGLKSSIKTKIFNIDVSPEDVYKERLNTCGNCPGKHAIYRNGALYSCGPMLKSMTDNNEPTCGCILSIKAKDTKEKCPMGYWKR